MAHNASGRIAVITIHGTNDTAAGEAGDKWFQQGSAFTTTLTARLSERGVGVQIIPFLWSGANSSRSREASARKLSKLIKRSARAYSGVHLIAHSHGGNVANTCASILNWRGARLDSRIATITTVGTPFFESAISRWDVLGALALLAAAAASAVSIVLTALSGAYLIIVPGLECASCTFELVFWPVIASAVACAFVAPLAMSGVAKVLRLTRPMRQTATIHSVVHPNDEAIAFLDQLNRIEFEALRKGGLWGASQTPALAFGVQFLTVMAALSIGLAALIVLGGDDLRRRLELDLWWRYSGAHWTQTSQLLNPATFLIVALALVPLTLAAAYACVRLFAGLIPELLLRQRLNRAIGAATKGMAFGTDNDERVRRVSMISHNFSSRLISLDGDLAERMRTCANGAADQLIRKYRWSLFNVGADNKTSLSAMATDAMTWDSLIHTTYFDQPELADLIALHITEEAQANERSSSAG